MWNSKLSILLCFDTFCGSRNSGKYYYNWSPNDINSRTNFTSSGHFATLYLDFNTMQPKPYTVELPKWDYKNESYEAHQALAREWSICEGHVKSKILVHF